MASSSTGGGSSESDSGARNSRRLSGLSPEKELLEQCRLASLRKSYCTQWNLPAKLCCSGCSFYLQAIEGKPPTGKSRIDTHGKSKKYECKRPWQLVGHENERADAPAAYHINCANAWLVKVATWIGENDNCNLARFKATPASATHSTTKRAIEILDDEQTKVSPEATVVDAAVEEDGRKKKKPKDNIELRCLSLNSQGHCFEIVGVPNTHVLIHKNKLAKLENIELKLKTMEGSLAGERFGNNAGHLTRTLLGVGLSSAPSLPISQAANIMPMFVGAFLCEHGLLDKTHVQQFARCFPSEAYLRDLMFNFAAENLLELAEKVKGKQVFLSCDKGNKKGVGHFVKVLSWFDGTRVQKQVLDIDGSEGSTDQCANAISASLAKVAVTKLQGQTTDSGGGGVLDGLATALNARALCRSNYLVASCSLHNLQLTLAKPMKDTMGEGGLDKRNVMQLLHAVYDLQDSMSQDVWKVLTTEAVLFFNAFSSTNTYVGNSIADQQFAAKWNKVKTFRDFEPALPDWKEKRMTCKFTAPVLTRWWTVGEGARAVMDCYLLLLKISQSVINSNSGKSNKIASGLQPLLLEAELYSDLALVHCYHCNFVCKHFKWMQESTDLSAVPGFQAHNTLVRYFLMQEQLIGYKTSILTNHASYSPFRRSLQNLEPAVAARQRSKVDTFLSVAIDACHKHFKRWMSKELLPAALLSEDVLAAVVARKMLKLAPVLETNRHYGSDVHTHLVDVDKFTDFITSGVDAVDTYEPLALHVARLIIEDDEDMRDMKQAPSIYKSWMYSTYLPLASQTQFVEAGVKEAKIVSQSDRSEQLRSAYAINGLQGSILLLVTSPFAT